MSTRKRRIENLEGELRPSERISLWLSDIEQFDSPADYFQSVLGRSESSSPAYKLLQEYSAQRKLAPKGRPDLGLDRAIVHRLERVLFLNTLCWAANSGVEKIAADCRLRLESAHQMIEILRCLRNSDAWDRPCEITSPTSPASAAKQHFASGAPAEHRNLPAGAGMFFVAKVEGMIKEILNDLEAVDLTVGSISERFFSGRQILFPSMVRAMDDARQDAGICAEKITEIEPGERACFDQLESAQGKSEILVRELVDYAQAVALLHFAERAKAIEVLKCHLEGSSATAEGTDVRR